MRTKKTRKVLRSSKKQLAANISGNGALSGGKGASKIAPLPENFCEKIKVARSWAFKHMNRNDCEDFAQFWALLTLQGRSVSFVRARAEFYRAYVADSRTKKGRLARAAFSISLEDWYLSYRHSPEREEAEVKKPARRPRKIYCRETKARPALTVEAWPAPTVAELLASMKKGKI